MQEAELLPFYPVSEMKQTAEYQIELSSDESMEEDRPILYRVEEPSQSNDK